MKRPSVNPLAPPLLALIAVLILGTLYWGFGVGKDALLFAVAALVVFAIPVVAIFGVTGIVIGVRRLLRGRERK